MHLMCPTQKLKIKSNFFSVHRDEAANQGLVRLGPNYSWSTEGKPQLQFSRKEERKRKSNLQHEQTFCHPVYAKEIPGFSEVPLCHYTFTNEFDFTCES